MAHFKQDYDRISICVPRWSCLIPEHNSGSQRDGACLRLYQTALNQKLFMLFCMQGETNSGCTLALFGSL